MFYRYEPKMITMKKLGVLLLIISANLFANNNLDGVWSGWLKQEGKESVKMQLHVTKVDENYYVGKSLLEIDSEEGKKFINFNIELLLEGEKIYFRDTKVYSKKLYSDLNLCLKRGVLDIFSTTNKYMMSGNWEAQNCLPGSFYFERLIKNSEGISSDLILDIESDKIDIKNTTNSVVNFDDEEECSCILKGQVLQRGVSELNKNKTIKALDTKINFDIRLIKLPKTNVIKIIDLDDIYNNRRLFEKGKFNTKSSEIMMSVWDYDIKDNDTITILLNGETIIDNHRLSNKKLVIPISLKADKNQLTIHADYLGKLPPITAMLSLHDGDLVSRYAMHADMKRSDTINIISTFK